MAKFLNSLQLHFQGFTLSKQLSLSGVLFYTQSRYDQWTYLPIECCSCFLSVAPLFHSFLAPVPTFFRRYSWCKKNSNKPLRSLINAFWCFFGVWFCSFVVRHYFFEGASLWSDVVTSPRHRVFHQCGGQLAVDWPCLSLISVFSVSTIIPCTLNKNSLRFYTPQWTASVWRYDDQLAS